MCHIQPPQKNRGAYILREPKGRPDLILLTRSENTQALFSAASILAVQGITARLVMFEDAEIFAVQDEAYRESVLPSNRADTTVWELATPHETAQEARRRLMALREKP